MISKLVVWGENREIARERTLHALKNYVVHGIRTNIEFLGAVVQNKAYIENRISTKYCDDHLEDLVKAIGTSKGETDPLLPAIAYLVYSFHEDLLYPYADDHDVWNEIGYWRDLMELKVSVDDKDYPVSVNRSNGGYFEFTTGGRKLTATLRTMEYGILQLVIDGHALEFYISHDAKGLGHVSHNGHAYRVRRHDILVEEDVFGALDIGGRNLDEIVSPMPGKVIKVNIRNGQKVQKGDLLMVVEAMKMENNILAPRDGVVETVNVKAGSMVDGSKELVTLANPKK